MLAAHVLDTPNAADPFAGFDAAGPWSLDEDAGNLAAAAARAMEQAKQKMLTQAKARGLESAMRASPQFAAVNKEIAKAQARAANPSAIGGFLSSAARAVTSPVASVVSNTVGIATDIAKGKNVLKTVASRGSAIGRSALQSGAMVSSLVPGIGAPVAAALSAADALASGQSITQAGLAAARGALPGGAIAQSAFDAAVTLAKGGSLTEAAISAARAQVPEGAARSAFDTGIQIAKTRSIDPGALAAVAARAGAGPVLAQVSRAAQVARLPASLSPRAALPTLGAPAAITAGRRALPGALSTLHPTAHHVARSLLRQPALRSQPLPALAQRLRVSVPEARQGLAGLLGAMRRVSMGDARGLDAIGESRDIEAALLPLDSFDAAAPRFASIAAPPRRTAHRYGARGSKLSRHHATRLMALVPAARHMPRPLVASLMDARGFDEDAAASDPLVLNTQSALAGFNANRPGIISPADFGKPGKKDIDGVMGPRTKSAIESYQRAHPPLLVTGKPSADLVDHIASRLQPGDIERAQQVATTPAPAPAASSGLSRDEIRQAQVMLAAWMRERGKAEPPDFGATDADFDGIAGTRTRTATLFFQKNTPGLTADGILGPKTLSALKAATAPKPSDPAPPAPAPPPPAPPPPPADPVVPEDPGPRPPAGWKYPPPPPGMTPAEWIRVWPTYTVGQIWTGQDGFQYQKTGEWAFFGPVTPEPSAPQPKGPPGEWIEPPPADPVVPEDPGPRPPPGWKYPPPPSGMTPAEWIRTWPTFAVGQIWTGQDGFQYQKTGEWGFFGPVTPEPSAPQPKGPPGEWIDPPPAPAPAKSGGAAALAAVVALFLASK